MAIMTFEITKVTKPNPSHKGPANIVQCCGTGKGICIRNWGSLFICIGNVFVFFT